MFEWIGGLALKLVSGPVIDAYKAHLSAGTSHETLAEGLAVRELEVQQREIELQTQLRIAQIGVWYEPEKIAEYVIVAYLAKIVVWDVLLGLGRTDALHGNAELWAGMIMTYMFAKRGAENVMKIWASKR